MRRLVVEVSSGMLRGTKAIVTPGGTLRVGRTERAELVVERDAALSGLHFELTWDGTTCRLRDLGSACGTKLSGAPVGGETPVPHGGWIQAGETSFTVRVEAASPSRNEERADATLAAGARAALAPRMGHLYAVLDAARNPRILELVRESVDEAQSLYEGVQGDALAEVAPYLVAFRPDSGLLDRLLEEGWGGSWGVFVESRASFKELRRQLRRFLMVEDEGTGERVYFRYYDPRVLGAFLPLATVRQRDEIFRDIIDAFLCEDESGTLAAFGPPAFTREPPALHAPDP